MTVSPADIRNLTLTGIFEEVPDNSMIQFIDEATKIYKGVSDTTTKSKLVALHAADDLFKQLKSEQGLPVDQSPFSDRLAALKRTLPSRVAMPIVISGRSRRTRRR